MVRHAVFALVLPLFACSAYASTSEGGQRSLNNELPEKIEFTVHDFASDEVRFVGDEVIAKDIEFITKVTTYRTPQSGKSDAESIVQRETVVYDGETLTTLSYDLKNFLTGESASLKLKSPSASSEAKANESYEMAYVPKEGERPVEGTVSYGERLRTGKVLHHVIVRNWSHLRAGKSADFDLLVPFKLDKFHFQFTKVSEQQSQLTLRLEPASWLIRKFVKPMDFIYEHENHQKQRLIRYVGPTTIDAYRDPDWKVKIDFRY